MSATNDYIREAREQKGLTLAQVADATRIPRYYLEILEGGGNEQLGNVTAPPETEARSTKGITVAVLAVLLLIVAGIYVYDPTLVNPVNLTRTVNQPAEEAQPAAPPEVVETPSLPTPDAAQTPPVSTEPSSVLQPEADETVPADPILAESPPAADSEPPPAAASETAGASESGATGVAEAEPPAATDSEPGVAETGTAPGAVSESAGVTEAEPEAPETAEAEPPTTAAASETEPPQTGGAEAAAAHTLTIAADSRSWMRVWVDDRPSRDLLLNAGQSATLSADTGFRITFGNAGGVRLTLNNQELPAVGRSGEVVRNYELPRPAQATP